MPDYACRGTDAASILCSYGFKDIHMDSHEDATACYELKMPVMCPIQPLKDACVSITMNIIYSANSHLKSEDSHTSILDNGTKIC